MPATFDASLTVHAWQCDFCNRTSLVFKEYDKDEGGDPVRSPSKVWIAWPDRAPRELPVQAPESIRSLYREASVAENASCLRGAAGLYRAVVEELMRDQSAEGRDLHARIEALRTRIDDDLVTDLHEARLTGNWGLHDGMTFSAEEVADVAQLIRDAVDILYVEPARRQAMREQRAARRESSQRVTPSE
jgi:hypothetical protein